MSTTDPAAVLRRYLAAARGDLLWKLEGLGERDVRLPRTPTGTNLLGIVLHCANVEIGYFGRTFGRAWPEPDHPCLVPDDAFELDPQADWWVPADISAVTVLDFYRAAGSFADAAFDELPLDATGRVPWWPEERAHVSLQAIAVHVLSDIARHAGHADVLREQADGAAGMRSTAMNLPDGFDWPAYVDRLTGIAEGFAD